MIWPPRDHNHPFHLQHKAWLPPTGACAFTLVLICIAGDSTAFSFDADFVAHGAVHAPNIYKLKKADIVWEQK